MRVWLVLLLLALVAVVMVSAKRGDEERVGRRGRGRIRPRPTRPGRGNEGEEGEEATGTKRPGRGRPGRPNKKKGRPGRRPQGVFGGSPAMKKCSLCVIKCKKVNRVSFEQCLSTNQTSPCYDLCSQASDNMMDCLSCIGECSRSVDQTTGKKMNAFKCVRGANARCKEQCAAPPAPSTTEVEGGEEATTEGGYAVPAQAWFHKYFF